MTESKIFEKFCELVEQLPNLNGLVNNAGLTETILTQFVKRENIEKVLGINTIAPILLTQKILKKKKISCGGSIVFTCSISGTCVAGGGNVLYSTSKGAIHGFVKNAALDLAVKGIRVNEVCPGMINTSILDRGKIGEEELRIYPMKRFAIQTTYFSIKYAGIYHSRTHLIDPNTLNS